jgi:hypothetical protein
VARQQGCLSFLAVGAVDGGGGMEDTFLVQRWIFKFCDFIIHPFLYNIA